MLGIILVGGFFALSGPEVADFVTQTLFAVTVLFLMSAGEWPTRKIFRLGWPGFMPLALAGPVFTILSGALSVIFHLSLTETVGPLPVITGLEESGLVLIILTVLVAPIVEEFSFRGYLRRAYEHAWPQGGWILTGILFGVNHAGAGMVRILTAPTIGLLYAWLFWRTKSL
jgi:membrane protease YdiL (CAAX protease family)